MEYKDLLRNNLTSMFLEELLTQQIGQSEKQSELSSRARQLGNKLFRSANHNAEIHHQILQHYSEALALAPNGSEELVLAYGNKSILLLHLRKFEDAVKDIDRGLSVGVVTNAQKVKLLCRKVECLVAMGKIGSREETLQEAKRCFQLLLDKDKEASRKIISRAEAMLAGGVVESDGDDRDTEHLRIRKYKESKGMYDSISLTHNSKYGQHFVAAKEIQPGEQIFISKPYVMIANDKKFHSYCAHCVNVLWSSVPCENCNFSLYCSQECKDEAQNSYHDIECRCLQFILAEGTMNYYIHVAVRSVIKGVKEFGSIKNLLEQVKQVDYQPADVEGFDEDSFKSLFKFGKDEIALQIFYLLIPVCKSVVALARYTSFFGENIQFHSPEDMLENDEVLSIASLIMKFSLTTMKEGGKVKEYSTQCSNGKDPITCSSTRPCCERGYFIDVTHKFIPCSCDPNVRSCMIEGGKELWYAIQPIAKGQPLFDAFRTTFFEMEKSQRSELIKKTFNRDCDCVACRNNWSAVLTSNGRGGSMQEMIQNLTSYVMHTKSIGGTLKMMIGEDIEYDQATVDDLRKVMTAAYEVYSQPSETLCSLICILRFVFDRLHGIKLRMPDNCRVI